jgi:hypothetical protein
MEKPVLSSKLLGINETLMKHRRYPASSTTGANVHTTTCPYLPPLGNDLRAVFHNQNHMLLLCTSSAVLVAKQVNHVSGGKDGRRSELYLS